MEHKKSFAVLLLGSNSGNRLQHIQKAEQLIKDCVGSIIMSSSLYETAPWGFLEQPDFLNKAIIIENNFKPSDLLNHLKSIEKKAGRLQSEKWKERIIDIDILFIDDIIYNEKELIVPHEMIEARRFTLAALNEIIPGYVHPVLKKKISVLLNECTDESAVKKLPSGFF